MRLLCGMIAASMVTLSFSAYSQIVTFNSPISWVTQRNDSITVRCQIDTAQLKGKNEKDKNEKGKKDQVKSAPVKKEFVLTVSQVNEKQQKKQLAKKTFPVTDYSGEFAMGPVGTVLAGGYSYLRIDWAIPGTDNKGYISPIGVVALDKLAPAPLAKVAKAKDGADAAGVAGALKDADFQSVGPDKYALAWNKDALYIVLVKQQKPAAGAIRFAIDGKNGKNAFLSFADRVVSYQASNDSLAGTHYSRGFSGDTLKYDVKPWPNEMKKTTVGDKIVISVPWFDSGIIPFGDRKFAIGIVTFDEKNKPVAAYPTKADFYLPGTWGDFELSK
jgi:hypothetical protein